MNEREKLEGILSHLECVLSSLYPHKTMKLLYMCSGVCGLALMLMWSKSKNTSLADTLLTWFGYSFAACLCLTVLEVAVGVTVWQNIPKLFRLQGNEVSQEVAVETIKRMAGVYVPITATATMILGSFLKVVFMRA